MSDDHFVCLERQCLELIRLMEDEKRLCALRRMPEKSEAMSSPADGDNASPRELLWSSFLNVTCDAFAENEILNLSTPKDLMALLGAFGILEPSEQDAILEHWLYLKEQRSNAEMGRASHPRPFQVQCSTSYHRRPAQRTKKSCPAPVTADPNTSSLPLPLYKRRPRGDCAPIDHFRGADPNAVGDRALQRRSSVRIDLNSVPSSKEWRPNTRALNYVAASAKFIHERRRLICEESAGSAFATTTVERRRFIADPAAGDKVSRKRLLHE